jgi:hypothetical protein
MASQPKRDISTSIDISIANKTYITMSIPFILSILAALCIVPTLIAGAISDYKTRTFPADYWKYAGKVAGFFVFLEYCMMVSSGQWIEVLILLGVSIVASAFFFFMGIRYGSGGDWRAMIYIAWIAPAMLAIICVFSLAVGFMQAIDALRVKSDVPIIMRNVPYAVAICGGFVIAIMFTIWSNV